MKVCGMSKDWLVVGGSNMWVESVPNFSEGRDTAWMVELRKRAQSVPGVSVLGLEGDIDHNRSVMTLVGPGEKVLESVFQSIEWAVRSIDLRHHRGVHPRMGAADVVPFIPLGETPMQYAVELARQLGERVARTLNVPVYLYEDAATSEARRNLAVVRRGEFEGLAARMATDPPDFGQQWPHPTAGATAVGARQPLIAFNVYLGTTDLPIAQRIARAVRGSSGGLVGVKALAMNTLHKGQVQVSMNLVNYPTTTLPRALEMVRMEAKRFGVAVTHTELIGFLPMSAVVDILRHYVQLEAFDASRVLEMAMAPKLKDD